MKPESRIPLPSPLLALLALALLGAAAAAPAPAQEPGKLAILSTTDVKGKIGPCGCKIPKGGFSRRASFTDSIQAQYDQVLVVDGGGFYPESDHERELARFQIDGMKMVEVEVAGVGDRDLRFGMSYLRESAKSKKLELVCANLVEKKSGKPLVSPWTVRKVGKVNVGVFGLISDKVDLGPSRDSLAVQDPMEAAKSAVAALRKKGATVIVLLSQLGKLPAEDLVTAVDGIDVLISGRNSPVRPEGRQIKGTSVAYPGEQGQHLGVTLLTLDDKGAVSAGESRSVALGAEVGERMDVYQAMQAFEDADRARRNKVHSGGTSGEVR